MNQEKHPFVDTSLNARPFLCILSLLIALMSGCSIHNDYQWSLYEIEPERIPSFNTLNSKAAVSIINAQPDKRSRELGHGAKGRVGSMGYHSYYGSLNEITDAVVKQLTHELEKRGMNVREGAAKKLEIKVRKTEFETGAWMLQVKMDVNVKAGKDYVRKVNVSNRTPGTIWRASDGAVALIVIKMLNDPKIIEYLTN